MRYVNEGTDSLDATEVRVRSVICNSIEQYAHRLVVDPETQALEGDGAAEVDEGPRVHEKGVLRRGREVAVGECTVAPEEPVLPLAARRSAVAFPTASGVARPVWALTQEMARS